MPLIIYKSIVSPPSQATMMIANILRIRVQTKEVSLPQREHYAPEYLEKNPLHTVPLLEEDDLILADSHAIITYLVSKHGGEEHEKLYPNDLRTRALIDQRMYFDATILFPRFKIVIYSLVKRNTGLSEEQVSDIVEAYNVLEKYLKGPYLVGDNLTVADVSCVATLSSLNCILPVNKKYVRINDWWNRLKGEEWYQRKCVPGVKLFDGFIKQFLPK